MRPVLMVFLLTICTNSLVAQSQSALFEKGEVFFNEGNYLAASQVYTQVIDLEPNNMNAYLRRGFCYSALNRFKECISDFGVVIERHPEHIFAYISRGSAFNKLGQFDQAIVDFDNALRIDPENQDAFNNRGWAKNGLKRYEEACADWKASKKLGNEEAKLILKNNHCK